MSGPATRYGDGRHSSPMLQYPCPGVIEPCLPSPSKVAPRAAEWVHAIKNGAARGCVRLPALMKNSPWGCELAHTAGPIAGPIVDLYQSWCGRDAMVRKADILTPKHMSEDEQRAFDRWISGSVVIGSILAAGLLFMALAGSGA
jgi:hypothetical protein